MVAPEGSGKVATAHLPLASVSAEAVELVPTSPTATHAVDEVHETPFTGSIVSPLGMGSTTALHVGAVAAAAGSVVVAATAATSMAATVTTRMTDFAMSFGCGSAGVSPPRWFSLVR